MNERKMDQRKMMMRNLERGLWGPERSFIGMTQWGETKLPLSSVFHWLHTGVCVFYNMVVLNNCSWKSIIDSYMKCWILCCLWVDFTAKWDYLDFSNFEQAFKQPEPFNLELAWEITNLILEQIKILKGAAGLLTLNFFHP